MKKIVFEEYFNKSNGSPFFYNGREIKMSDKVSLQKGKLSIIIEFVSTDSNWKQGIVLQTKGSFEVNGFKVTNKIVLWEHTAPKKIEILVNSKDKVLFIYNAWSIGDEVLHYGHNGGALFVEHQGEIRTYHCNDGEPDDDFNDLVFQLAYQ